MTSRAWRVVRRKAIVGLLGLAFALAVLGVLWHERREPDRRGIVPLPTLGAELLFLETDAVIRRGPKSIVAVRFAAPVEFRPYHFRHDRLPAPMTIEAWAAHLGAPLVFNAGQFDEGLEYLGWLKRDDRWLSERRKAPWKGLLVSGPVDGAFWGRIVDLDHAEATVVDRYRHVVQSMMLLDSDSRLRVRDTDWSACRTVVAEDTRGRILVIVTEGAVTLGDLARWLDKVELDIVRAMNLDGGLESQLAIDTPELKLALYGQYGTGTTVWNAGGGQIRYPIPAVIAVRPLVKSSVPP